jgi:hypothetical protein
VKPIHTNGEQDHDGALHHRVDAGQCGGDSVRGYGHLPPCRIARDGIGLVPEGREVAPIEIASGHYVIERPHQLERSVA